MTEGCGQEGELLDRTSDGFPPSVIQRKFEQKGWEVGKSDKHDYCPSCVEKATIARRARRNGNKVIQLVSPQPTPPQGEVMSTTDTIGTASRDDKRTIFAKLQDVYLDETKGYMAPWTDNVVAKDLGCPVSWVAQMREENFGPARDNSEIRDMLDRVERAARETQIILADAKGLQGEIKGLIEQNNRLNKRIDDVARSLAGLLAIADRVGKAVS